MLTDQQLAHWRTFGFLVLREVFSLEEMDEIRAAFDAVMEEERQGHPFDGKESQTVLWFVEHRPELARLAEDDSIYGRMEQLLGPGFIWLLSDGNYYVGDTQWHGGKGGPVLLPHVKIAIYPDQVTKETGCLRVIPGSHRAEYRKHLKVLKQQYDDAGATPFGVTGAQVPAYPLESDPGDMVFFSESLWHSSFGGRAGRRMVTLIYGENPDTVEKRDSLRETRKTTIAMYNPQESFINSDSPRIRAMVEPYARL